MSLVCDPASLLNSAKCFAKCISPRDHIAVQNYLLAVILGGSTDPKVIVKAAACFLECIAPGQQQSVANYLLCQLANKPTVVISAAAQAWGNQVVTNGGPMPSQNTLVAVTNFLTSIATIQSKIYTANLIVPDSMIAARTPIIATVGGNLYGLSTVGAGGGTLSINGYRSTADGANGVVMTSLTPNTIPSFNTGNGGMSIYAAINTPPDASALAGVADSAFGSDLQIFAGTGNFLAYVWSITAVNVAAITPGCFQSVSRTANNLLSAYSGNSSNPFALVGSNANVNASNPALNPMTVGGQNAIGVGIQLCKHTISFFAVHDGLSLGDTQILFNAVQAARVAIGGGFV